MHWLELHMLSKSHMDFLGNRSTARKRQMTNRKKKHTTDPHNPYQLLKRLIPQIFFLHFVPSAIELRALRPLTRQYDKIMLCMLNT